MRRDTLQILRCPYCGGRLELVESFPNTLEAGAILEGILACHCCLFPVVGGIPVMHLRPNAVAAREAIEAGESDQAFRALVSDDDDRAARFTELASGHDTTFRELADALGEELEGGYFLYRFSDPSFVTASAVVRAVGGAALRSGGRAIDVCGGAGHLTRVLLELSQEPPVVADLYFAKLWLAARYVAPGCEAICCDGNAPLPFARGTFDFALCADAFMYIWTKRQLVGEMERLVAGGGPGAVVITHAHNQHVWSASHGDPLPPEGYRDLFESIEPRLFAESKLLDDVVAGGPLDLSRKDDLATLAEQEAVTIVAARGIDAYRAHPLGAPMPVAGPVPGELRLNPLYAGEEVGMGVRMRLAFPSEHYEEEYGAVRRYLPEELTLDRATVAAVSEGQRTPQVRELLRKRIVLDMPERYY